MELMTTEFLKPAVAGGIAYLIESQYYKTDNMTALKFGGAVAVGVFSATTVDNMLGLESSKVLSSGKGLENRFLEIGTASASAYVLNKYILQNDYSQEQMFMKLGQIVIADVLAEYAVEAFKAT